MAQAQSDARKDFSIRPHESDIRQHEKWRTFYDSLSDAEKADFNRWWADHIRRQQDPTQIATKPTYDPNNKITSRREAMNHWYKEKIVSQTDRDRIKAQYQDTWAKRAPHVNAREKKPVAPRVKTEVKVYRRGTGRGEITREEFRRRD